MATFGDPEFGGDSSAVAGQLSANVVAVFSTNSAFAALLANGTATTWGDPSCGGDASAAAGFLASGITTISATACAFAARNQTGAVAAWGGAAYGGDASAVAASLGSGVLAVYSTPVKGDSVGAGAFVALLPSGAVCWGAPEAGGNCSTVSNQVVNITAVFSNTAGFAAVTNKGAVVSWGNGNYSIPGTAITSGASSVSSTAIAWAVLTSTGKVVPFGDAAAGGNLPTDVAPIRDKGGVQAIYSNQAAFVAKLNDSSLVAVSCQPAVHFIPTAAQH